MSNNVFFAILKNEIAEQIRSGKSIVIVFVFLFFGILSPITAMYMPEIIGSISESQNIKIVVPEPTWLDAVTQYVKNLSQMGSFILIIVYMGVIAREKENGILVFLLVKPVKRSIYVMSKYISVTLAASVGIAGAFVASTFYTYIFFDGFEILSYTYFNLFMLLNILSTIYIVVLFSMLFKSQILAGIFSFALYLIFGLGAQIKALANFLPSGLLEQGNNAILGLPINYTPVAATIVLCLACVVISHLAFRKWEA